MHTMLTVHLTTRDVRGALVSSRLTFVELAPVEAKVGRGRCAALRPAPAAPRQRAALRLLSCCCPMARGGGCGRAAHAAAPGCPQDPLGWSPPADAQLAKSLARSYSTLGKVLAGLRQAARPGACAAVGVAAGGAQHLPWRESPLTRWLQGKLQAASNVLLLATVSASPEVGGCAGAWGLRWWSARASTTLPANALELEPPPLSPPPTSARTAPQAAADTLATLGYVSRFRTGRGAAVLISAVWDDGAAGAAAAAAAAAAQAGAGPRPPLLPATRLQPPPEDSTSMCNQASPEECRWAAAWLALAPVPKRLH
jgi:hypothetical protein